MSILDFGDSEDFEERTRIWNRIISDKSFNFEVLCLCFNHLKVKTNIETKISTNTFTSLLPIELFHQLRTIFLTLNLQYSIHQTADPSLLICYEVLLNEVDFSIFPSIFLDLSDKFSLEITPNVYLFEKHIEYKEAGSDDFHYLDLTCAAFRKTKHKHFVLGLNILEGLKESVLFDGPGRQLSLGTTKSLSSLKYSEIIPDKLNVTQYNKYKVIKSNSWQFIFLTSFAIFFLLFAFPCFLLRKWLKKKNKKTSLTLKKREVKTAAETETDNLFEIEEASDSNTESE